MRQTEKMGRKARPTDLPEVREVDATLVPGGVGPWPPQGPPDLGIEQGRVAAVGAYMAGLLGTVLEREGAGLQEGGPVGATCHHRAHQPLGSGQRWGIQQVPHQDQRYPLLAAHSHSTWGEQELRDGPDRQAHRHPRRGQATVGEGVDQSQREGVPSQDQGEAVWKERKTVSWPAVKSSASHPPSFQGWR